MRWRSGGAGRPDQIFMLCQNTSDATLEVGYSVFLDRTQGRISGYCVRVYKIDTTANGGNNPADFVGVVAESPILPGSWGFVQTYGHIGYAKMNHSISNTTSQRDRIFFPAELYGNNGMLSCAALATNGPFYIGAFLGGIMVPGEVNPATGQFVKGFLKCM